jgi:hypothetical protein
MLDNYRISKNRMEGRVEKIAKEKKLTKKQLKFVEQNTKEIMEKERPLKEQFTYKLMEFIVNYGWVILIVIASIIALLYFK